MDNSLVDEVDDLIGQTRRSLRNHSPAGQLSTSNTKPALPLKNGSGMNFGIIRLVGLVFLCDFLLLTMVVPILPMVFKGTSFASPINLALVFASKPVAQIVLNPCAGYVVDRFGPRGPLLLGSLVATAASGVFIFALLGIPPADKATTVRDTYRFVLCIAARVVQGAASAFTNSSGFTLVVKTHHEEVRGSAVGIASIGIALGALMGPPLAGLLGSIAPWVPFCGLCGLLLLSMMLQVCTPYSTTEAHPRYCSSRLRGSLDAALLSADDNQPFRYAVRGSNLDQIANGSATIGHDSVSDINGGSITGCRMLRDPMILVVAAAATIANATVGMIEPLIPLYMERTLLAGNPAYPANGTNSTTGGTTVNDGVNSESEKTRIIGLVFATSTLTYLVFTPIAGVLGDRLGGNNTTRNRRYLVILFGIVILACGLCSFWLMGHGWTGLIVGLVGIGLGMAFIDAPVAALLADIMDVRGLRDSFGTVYAIQDTAISIGFAIGPLLGAGLQHVFEKNPTRVIPQGGEDVDDGGIGFRQMSMVFGVVCLAYAPFVLCLRRLNPTEETTYEMRRGVSVNGGSRTLSSANSSHFRNEHGVLARGGNGLLSVESLNGEDYEEYEDGGGGGGGLLMSGGRGNYESRSVSRDIVTTPNRVGTSLPNAAFSYGEPQ